MTLSKKANSSKLQAAGFLSGGEVSADPVVWDIPQNEKMKFHFIQKGTLPEGGASMIINLHGGGSFPHVSGPWASADNRTEWSNLIYMTRYYPKDNPSFYLIPRMADDRKGRWYLAPQIAAFKRAFRLGILSGMANPLNVHLMGVSEGGYGTLRLALFMPDCFAAAGVLAAAEQPGLSAVNLRNIAFRMDVGALDNDFSRSYYAYHWQDKMKELHAENPKDYVSEVYVHPGQGHAEIEMDSTATWLIGHTRRPYPSRVSYEYHNIAPDYPAPSGAYSTGVYFLDFRKLTRSTQKDRMLFDVKRHGNRFDVTTKKTKGNVAGELTLYIDKIDFALPVEVTLNGKQVHADKVRPSRGVMAESIAMFGDPERIFAAKVKITLSET